MKTAQQINSPQVGRIEPPTVEDATIAQLKAQLEAAQKELQAFKFNGDYSVRLAVATVTEKLQKERDAAQKAKAEAELRLGNWEVQHDLDAMTQQRDDLRTELATVEGKLEAAQAKLEAAQKACAEMREAIETLMGPCRDQIDCYLHRQFPATVGHVPLREYFNRLFASANTDCGKDFVPKEQVKPLVDALRAMISLWESHGTGGDHKCVYGAKQALAHAKELGIEP